MQKEKIEQNCHVSLSFSIVFIGHFRILNFFVMVSEVHLIDFSIACFS